MKNPPNSNTSLLADIVFWQAIVDSEDPYDFEDYLMQFPDGQFVALAHRRFSHAKIAAKGGPLLNEHGRDALIIAAHRYGIDVLEWLKVRGANVCSASPLMGTATSLSDIERSATSLSDTEARGNKPVS